MALTDILNTARDAISAQQYGLGVTGQNVANVNTPGYVRRRAQLQSKPLGDKDFGTVVVTGVQRLTDQYTEQRHYAAIGLSSSAGERDRLLGHIESLFDVTNDEAGIGGALSEFFSAFSQLSTDPQDLTARAQVLARAEAVASRFNETAESIATFRTGLTQEAVAATDEINQTTRAIAEVTNRIMVADAAEHDASDLRDRRDALILDLSKLVDVRTFQDGNGQLVIQGAGTTLVEGDNARRLSIGLQPSGDLQINATSEGGATTNVSRYLLSGRLGAIRDLHDTDTAEVLARLDQLAMDVTTAINDQHALGFGTDGTGGQDVFRLVGSGVSSPARNLRLNEDLTVAQVAAAGTAAGVPGDGDNAIALSQLSFADLASGGTQTASEAYGAIVADVGARKAQAASDHSVRMGLETQAFTLRESLSGVNLDEEMVSLTKFQRAFEAAAKVLTTADELLEQLIERVGR